MKLGTLFHGFGGFDIGAKIAGLSPAWGIELDDRIAEVARQNGMPVFTADANAVNAVDYEDVGWIHASPPCPNFSVAKTAAAEGKSDIALARSITRFLSVHEPKVFTLGNVTPYRHSESFRIICRELTRLGYFWDVLVLCASDFGVPQTRLRIILCAKRGEMLRMIHGGSTSKLCWYRAIEDFAEDLPDVDFAKWQKKFVDHAALRAVDSFAMTGSNSRNVVGYRPLGASAFTVTASQKACTRLKLPSGRVVSAGKQVMARWQTFPDEYMLPDSNVLALRGIGNAIPPEMATRIVEQIL